MRAKISITLDQRLINKIDQKVKGSFYSRSACIEHLIQRSLKNKINFLKDKAKDRARELKSLQDSIALIELENKK